MSAVNDPIRRAHTALDDFRQQLELAERYSEISYFQKKRRRFFLASRIVEWFRSPVSAIDNDGSTNAGRVLRAVYGTDDRPGEIRHLLMSLPRDDGECWLLVFTILLQLNHNGECLGKYIRRFNEHDVFDHFLPRFGEKRMETCFSNILRINNDNPDTKRLAKRFCELQWELCAIQAFDVAGNRIYDYGETIIPVTRKSLLKTGGTGTMYMVEVPQECIPPKLSKELTVRSCTQNAVAGTTGEVFSFALKLLDHERPYHDEREAYLALGEVDGIVRCLCSWQLLNPNPPCDRPHEGNNSEYYLLLECGDYDLSAFFRLYPPPATAEDILVFWEALSRLVSALEKIHRCETVDHDDKRRTKTIYLGWHCDIKPDNIVYFRGKKKGGWKIADPGFANFKRESKVDKYDGLPVIRLTGGTRAYGAPKEFEHGDDALVSQLFDIWSLGCVFSEAATWVTLGHRGVQLFQKVRKSSQLSEGNSLDSRSISGSQEWEQLSDASQEDSIKGLDRFHDGSKMSQTVSHWHEYVRQSIRTCDHVTKDILRILEAEMLSARPTERSSAAELVKNVNFCLGVARTKIKRDGTLYRVPSYFRHAIALEQRQEASAVQCFLGEGSESWRSKYKSKAFIQATGVPHLEDGPDDGQYSANEALADFAEGSLTPDAFKYARTSKTMPTNFGRRRDSRMNFPRRGDLDQTDTDTEVDTDFIDYMGARRLLEEAGWRPGCLELPHDPGLEESSVESFPSHNAVPGTHASSRPTFQPPRINTRFPEAKKPRGSVLRRLTSTKSWFSISTKHQPPVTPSQTALLPPTRPKPEALQRASTIGSSHENSGQSTIISHREERFDSYFKDRDIVILVDNGSSMIDHWIFARDILVVLVALLHGQDDDGIDLFNSSSRLAVARNLHEPRDFAAAMDTFRPVPTTSSKSKSRIEDPFTQKVSTLKVSDRSSTASTSSTVEDLQSISDVLDAILTDWSLNFQEKKRKMTLIILTDGVWSNLSSKTTVAMGIVQALAKAHDKKALKKQMETRGLSIQFVRFGNDQEAVELLDWMDDDLTGWDGERLPDIIDHEPADGNIYKMILGSLDSKYDERRTSMDEGEDDRNTVTAHNESELYDEPSGDATEGDAGSGSAVSRAGSKHRRSYTKYIAGSGSQFDKPVLQHAATTLPPRRRHPH